MLLHLRLITLHGVRSKSLKLGRQSLQKQADTHRNCRSIQIKLIWQNLKALRNCQPGNCQSSDNNYDCNKRCRCWILTSPYSKAERATEAETWHTRPRKAIIQLECIGQVCWVTELRYGATNILETKAYELTDKEKVPVIKNWLGQEGLQCIEMFTNEDKECKTAKGLLPILSHKFKPCHNRIVLSLQYLTLKRKAMNPPQNVWAGCRQRQENVTIRNITKS